MLIRMLFLALIFVFVIAVPIIIRANRKIDRLERLWASEKQALERKYREHCACPQDEKEHREKDVHVTLH